MKKLVTLFVAMFAVVVLAGCSTQQDNMGQGQTVQHHDMKGEMNHQDMKGEMNQG